MADRSSNTKEPVDNCGNQNHRTQEISTGVMAESKSPQGEAPEKNEKDAYVSEKPNKAGTMINSDLSPASENSNASGISMIKKSSQRTEDAFLSIWWSLTMMIPRGGKIRISWSEAWTNLCSAR